MKFNTLIAIAVFSVVLALSANASAGYLVNYQADPFISCDQCSDQPMHSYHHRHHTYRHHYYRPHHYSKTRSHYSIQVYYTWNPYPDYSCGSCGSCCQQQSCRVAQPRCHGTDYKDGFATYPVHEYAPCSGGCNGAKDYDTSTADDNYEYWLTAKDNANSKKACNGHIWRYTVHGGNVADSIQTSVIQLPGTTAMQEWNLVHYTFGRQIKFNADDASDMKVLGGFWIK